ncbi:PQQ-dependent sugar dehydrogenase [Thalassomonas haliotis]|uniref:PQQ-dependent sugar dehydrogenase n=1 Tax=Thalassomonas haliotis TaxID=485448 RepID=A0ABY7VB63_9GAMM|nr:PQQ-dependent sugar dehydrogenase [Thalassomonas haliotis]WDE10545.1 PQQ-dependent sugar dehydrogenase [Thalassomonas haliotis]
MSKAADVDTSFETTDLSGSFTLGTAPNTVTFTNGEAKFAAIASLYRSGSQAFMVQNNTATVSFTTPAAELSVFLKAQSGAAGATVNVFDIDDNLVDSFTATTSWQELNITSSEGISTVELINNTSSYAVFDDFSFTALNTSEPPDDPVKLDDPIALPIFSGGLKLVLEPFSQGLVAPVWGTNAPGINDYFYVIDQVGFIWGISAALGDKTLIADLSASLVDVGIDELGGFDERGLLGLAFHPDFVSNKTLYTFSSQPVSAVADFSTMPAGENADHQGVLTQWFADIGGEGGLTIDPESAQEILRIDQPQFNHNGGAITFDNNNLLYIALGDGGGADDTDGQSFLGTAMVGHGSGGNGQDKGNVLGTILRIDPAGNNSENGAYGIPQDNPFVGISGVDEIFAYGLRNPYRISFDAVSGNLYAGDVGQNDIEEINNITSGGNYGWNIREGSFGFFANGDNAGYVYSQSETMGTIDPVAQYDHGEGSAVIGGFVYRGTSNEDLQGRYVFGDFNGRLFYLNNENTLSEFQDKDEIDVGAILGFARDAGGELYVLANENGLPDGSSGALYKMTLLPNQPPLADAGSAQTVNEGVVVTLNAGGSSDPDGDILMYQWSQSSGTSVTLHNPTTASPTFTAPGVNSTTGLSFTVEVNDGHLADNASVDITVNNIEEDSGGSGGGSLSLAVILLALVFTVKGLIKQG